MDCFYIITNKLKDKDYAITSQIEQYIQSSGKKCFLSEKDSEGHIIPGTVPKEAECGLVLGGDGTLIRAKDAEILEVTAEGDIGEEDEPEGIGRVSDLEIPMTLRECCEDVKDAFHLGAVKVFGNLEDKVKRIAICPGSGKSVIQAALDKHADVLITGDIGHHEGIDAVAQGMAIIDGGHYGIEHIFIEDMRQYLEKNLKDVEVISAPIIHPFLLV